MVIFMAQTKPAKKVPFNQVLKLVDQLLPKEQERLVEQMKLQWLRREVQKGIDQADRGELLDAEVVFAELEKRYQGKSKKR